MPIRKDFASTLAVMLIVMNASIAAEGTPCTQDQNHGNLICFNGVLRNPCETGSGLGSRICAGKSVSLADKEMNQAYRAVIGKFERSQEDLKLKAALIHAQRKWIVWRDAICEFEASAHGGSPDWQAAAKFFCLERMTRYRTESLNAYWACHQGNGNFACHVRH